MYLRCHEEPDVTLTCKRLVRTLKVRYKIDTDSEWQEC